MADVNVVWHKHKVSREEHETRNGHKACVLWFTGLSASGKSTIAGIVECKLFERGVRTYLLDGDNVRHGLNAGPSLLTERYGLEFANRFGLGFSAQEREENIRRIGAVAKLFCDAGTVTLAAIISPYRRDRDAVRSTLGEGDFIEIFVDAPLSVCEARDPKGLYRKARAGEIKDFTGLHDPYEIPQNPSLILDAGSKDPNMLADEVISHLVGLGLI